MFQSTSLMEHEISVNHRIRSPFVIQFCGILKKDKGILFPYYEKGTMKKYIYYSKNYIPSLSVKMKWAFQAAVAIYDLHSIGLIHKDIKPSNYMINNNMDAMLNDFSSASEKKDHIEEGGTVYYNPPEYYLKKKFLLHLPLMFLRMELCCTNCFLEFFLTMNIN